MRMPSLVVRLCANILAGHLLLEILGSFAFKLLALNGIIFGFIFCLVIIVIVIIKLFVSFLQAYILLYLSIIYMREFLEGPFTKKH